MHGRAEPDARRGNARGGVRDGSEPHRAAKHSLVTAELAPSRTNPRVADSAEVGRPCIGIVEHQLHSEEGHSPLKDGGRSGILGGSYWVREVQSGPPLGPSRSKGSKAGCRLWSGSRGRSKCPPPRFVRGGRAAGRRRSIPNGESRRVSRSTRARRGRVDVSVGIFGDLFQ
jgi:hypothetical protein